ncbi:motility associated factor glycosyltransferase family protein [Paenibacillus alginolyticus]|uniref:DUF115 domain-containing protein n=1 Tax=Paenibacillus alginolyticus TaxID=59839 RepID=A0ABT4G859_9BACL|nr:6-hydroxymethylpterin diphosphokinase MptE-like protein [Paenibacillus alginolyticus]MCY9692360.1 DUF115 domain-containing protein [Paenibacillus alginolyticus]MEC0143667.1 DUF115 domain-containing protein [Paenibacillus alginolyticus]
MSTFWEINLNALKSSGKYVDLIKELDQVNPSAHSILANLNKHDYFQSVIEHNHIHDMNSLRSVVILGFEQGMIAEELLKRCLRQTTILVIDSDLESLKYVLMSRDLSEILIDPRLVLMIARETILKNTLKTYFLQKNTLFLTNRVLYVDQPIYEPTKPNYTMWLKEQFVLARQGLITLLGNSAEDTLLGLKNTVNNIENVINSYPLDLMKERLSKIPAVCVAAGPSLEKNISVLKQMKDHVVVIAVDTIAERLRKEGIVPNFVCSMERGEEVYESFYKGKTFDEKTILIGLSLLDPRIIREFEGGKSVVSPAQMPFDNWLKDSFSNLTFLDSGHSAAHLNYSLAVHLGCDPIILVGQDLAYGSVGSTHAKGTYDENEYIKQRSDLNQFHEKEMKFSVPGFYGGEVLTNRWWVLFRQWFEENIPKHPNKGINATEGGAFIKGAEHLSLIDVFNHYCNKSVDFSVLNTNDYSDNKLLKSEQIAHFLPRINEVIHQNEKYRGKLKKLLIDIETLNNHRKWEESKVKVLTNIVDFDRRITLELSTDKNLAQTIQYANFTYRSKMNRLIELEDFSHVQQVYAYLKEFITTIIYYAEKLNELYQLLVSNVMASS